MHIFKNTNFDFLKWRWQAIALSWLIIVAGAVVLFTRGIPLGIEFAGGTSVIVQFEQATSATSRCATRWRSTTRGAQDTVVQAYGDAG